MRRKDPLPVKRDKPQETEVFRQRYRPARVKVLFVGESPPASGRFFYHANSGLYRAIRRAFIRAIPSLEEQDFLKHFQQLGCYLVDLCPNPVNRLDGKERIRACTQSELRLVKAIKQLQPDIIISVVRSISKNVERARERANWTGRHLNLPYPGRWRHNQIEFEEGLFPVLRMQYGDVHLHVKDVPNLPAVVVDGKLASCCAGRGPNESELRAAGIGQPL
jgi:hypothetical protein